MAKMWAGLNAGVTDQIADDFNSSIGFDSRMYKQDITGSIAHAEMLSACGIISQPEKAQLVEGLLSILEDLESGALPIDPGSEDIHMFVEQELTKRIGDTGKKLHTARSRNDQVALDLRLYLRDQAVELKSLLRELVAALHDQAAAHKSSIMPGYTHLQRAQPISFGHHLLAYCMMLLRDAGRIDDALRRMDVSPIGCCALAGTTYETDRVMEAKALGFSAIALNSLDGVSDRDYCLELMSALSILMMHLSRLSEELILWCSWEFKFITLSDSYTTGSSIMPQKKNPDMAELIRGKTGRVYGDLMTLLTAMKALPLASNKDMQEDKEAVFDALDTAQLSLEVLAPMLRTATFHPDNMKKAALGGFINATDCADYMTKKGVPFRDAYCVTGQLVNRCIELGTTLDALPLAEYRAFSPVFDEDVYAAIDLLTCVRQRSIPGGPAPETVAKQIEDVRAQI